MFAHLGALIGLQGLGRRTKDRSMLEARTAFRNIGKVTDHSRCRGIAAGTGAGQQQFAQQIGFNRNRIGDAMDLRNHR